MKINLKNGVDKLLFGMKQSDVTALYGKADKQYTDEEDNVVLLYDQHKLRLTFYAEEDLKLGYIIGSASDLELSELHVIGKKSSEAVEALKQKGLQKWTTETFDSYENFFNEDNWIILQSEFGEIIKVEIGAIINDKDEFDWKFKK